MKWLYCSVNMDRALKTFPALHWTGTGFWVDVSAWCASRGLLIYQLYLFKVNAGSWLQYYTKDFRAVSFRNNQKLPVPLTFILCCTTRFISTAGVRLPCNFSSVSATHVATLTPTVDLQMQLQSEWTGTLKVYSRQTVSSGRQRSALTGWAERDWGFISAKPEVTVERQTKTGLM